MIFGLGKKERARLERIAGIENAFHHEMRPRSLFAATLPLKEPTDIARRRVVSLVARMIEEAGGDVREHDANPVLDGLQRDAGLIEIGRREPEHQLIALWIGGVGVAITLAPVRIKDIEGLATFFSPSDWEWVGRDIKRHKAHVAIYDFGFEGEEQPGGRDAAFNRAAAVTSAAAALGEELEALGICWHAASNALRHEGLMSAKEELVRGHAPLDLWTRFYRTEAMPGEQPGVVSSGLAPFVGHELEVVSSTTEVQIAQNLARQLASDLLDRGLEMKEGEVVKTDEETAARIATGAIGNQKIWRLSFVDPWEY